MRKQPTSQPAPSQSDLELEQAMSALSADDVQLPDLDAELGKLDRVNPMDAVPETGDAEKDCKGMMSAALVAFKKAATGEAQTFKDNTDTEYWFAVCFQSREQKDAFLKAMDWANHGDKYLDGKFVAKRLGVELPTITRKFNTGETEKSMVGMGTIPANFKSKKKLES